MAGTAEDITFVNLKRSLVPMIAELEMRESARGEAAA